MSLPRLPQLPDADRFVQGVRRIVNVNFTTTGPLTLGLDGGRVGVFRVAVAAGANISEIILGGLPTAVSGEEISFMLLIGRASTSSTLTWGTGFRFKNDTAPSLTSAAGRYDVFMLQSYDGGTTFTVFESGGGY